jgi:hypothetical protein
VDVFGEFPHGQVLTEVSLMEVLRRNRNRQDIKFDQISRVVDSVCDVIRMEGRLCGNSYRLKQRYLDASAGSGTAQEMKNHVNYLLLEESDKDDTVEPMRVSIFLVFFI